MLKTLATIVLATSIVFAPAAAMAQAGPPVTANHSREGVITAGTMATPKAVAMPANAKSPACAKEASAKGLSGKPRKKFIAKCEKGRNGAGMN